jgi:hypothetical protein
MIPVQHFFSSSGRDGGVDAEMKNRCSCSASDGTSPWGSIISPGCIDEYTPPCTALKSRNKPRVDRRGGKNAPLLHVFHVERLTAVARGGDAPGCTLFWGRGKQHYRLFTQVLPCSLLSSLKRANSPLKMNQLPLHPFCCTETLLQCLALYSYSFRPYHSNMKCIHSFIYAA